MPGPAKAPTIGPSDTTNGGGSGYRRPGDKPPTDTFNDFLEAPSPAKALPCEVEHDVVRGDVPDPDAPVGAAVALAVLAQLKHELRMRAYPPRAATMSPQDMVDELTEKPRPKTYLLNGDQLAAARKQAGIRATVDA